jgi:N6-adenosine-specific RNA methylase IME4
LIEKPALADLGVTLTQSSRWQKLAALDDEEFEARKAKASREAVASVAQTRDERQAEKKERRQAREVDLGARIAALPNKRYGVIVADPEWKFKVWSTESGMDRAAENHFPTSELDKIKARDVPSISAPDCALGLWATVPMLPQALEVMAAWGFTYKSNHDWIKHRAGTGYWNRNMHEHFLIGVRGNVPAPAMGDQWPSVIEAPAGKHSAKPEIFLEMMEQYFPSLPKLEMNCRGLARPNWDAWGWESEQPAEAAE